MREYFVVEWVTICFQFNVLKSMSILSSLLRSFTLSIAFICRYIWYIQIQNDHLHRNRPNRRQTHTKFYYFLFFFRTTPSKYSHRMFQSAGCNELLLLTNSTFFFLFHHIHYSVSNSWYKYKQHPTNHFILVKGELSNTQQK